MTALDDAIAALAALNLPTTPGGHPYPTAASPATALWLALTGYAKTLDGYDGSLTSLSASVATLQNAATSQPRRLMTKSTAQATVASTSTRLTWQTDAGRGDVVPAASDYTGIQIDSTGLISFPQTGLYRLQVSLPQASASAVLYPVLYRYGGGNVTLAQDGTGATKSPLIVDTTFTVTKATTSTLTGDQVSVNYIGQTAGSLGGAASNSGAYAPDSLPRFSLNRLAS